MKKRGTKATHHTHHSSKRSGAKRNDLTYILYAVAGFGVFATVFSVVYALYNAAGVAAFGN